MGYNIGEESERGVRDNCTQSDKMEKGGVEMSLKKKKRPIFVANSFFVVYNCMRLSVAGNAIMF